MTAVAEWAEYAAREFEPQEPLWVTPGDLAAAIDPTTVQTAALDLVDDALAWAYSTPGARLLVSLAPQEGKSQRVTRVGSLWALIRDPERRMGIVSYSQALAEGFGRDVRNWISTFDGTDDTLDLGLRIAPDYGSAKRWQLDGHRGGVVCAGIGSGLTGRPLEALVIDDPFADAEQAGSAYYRDRVWDWWQSVGAPRLAPSAPVIVILTRWHEDDLAGRLVAAEDGHRWRVINIPALADHDPAKGQSDPLGREPGVWLTSARGRTVAEWKQIKIQAGSRVFAALYQGRPSPDQGNVWLRHWWRRYHEPLWSQHPDVPGAYLVHDVDELILSWDMAFKDLKSSDFVVGQVWARRGADVFLLDQVHKRLSFTDTLIAFAAMVARWPQAARKLVEDKANGTAVISTLKSKIPGLVPVNPTDSKYGRATAVAPFVEAGNALLPAPEVALFDVDAFLEECVSFPNGAHDDQVDAASQALAELLLDGTGAQAWIAWAKRKAEAAAGGGLPALMQPAAADDGAVLVPSSSGNGTYRVTPDGVCTCPAGQHGKPCKHLRTARLGAGTPAPAQTASVVPSRHANGNGHTPAEPLPADPLAARKRARDAAFREQSRGW